MDNFKKKERNDVRAKSPNLLFLNYGKDKRGAIY